MKITLANDHHLMRSGYRIYIEKTANYKVVLKTSSFDETIEKTGDHDIDILLLDDVMPGGEILPSPERINNKCPDLNIIVTTLQSGKAPNFRDISKWAHGLLSYASNSEQCFEAIETVYRGGVYYYVPGLKKLGFRWRSESEVLPSLKLRQAGSCQSHKFTRP